MAQQPTVALAQIKIKGAGEYVTILSLQIDTQSNQHGSMIVTLRLETDEIKSEEKDWTGAQIQAETKEGILLFTGECIRYDVKRLAADRKSVV